MDPERLEEIRKELEKQKKVISLKEEYDNIKLMDSYKALLSSFNDLYVTYKNDAYKSAEEGKNASALMLQMRAMEDAIVMLETHLTQESEQAKSIIDQLQEELSEARKKEDFQEQLDESGSMV